MVATWPQTTCSTQAIDKAYLINLYRIEYTSNTDEIKFKC